MFILLKNKKFIFQIILILILAKKEVFKKIEDVLAFFIPKKL